MGLQVSPLAQKLVVSILLALCWTTTVLANNNPELTRAEVDKLLRMGIAELLLKNKSPRRAVLKDAIAPQDAIRTGTNSEAQLLFNEKTVARVDERTTFEFVPGLRRFQVPNRIALNEMIFKLENGTALILSPPGSVGTEVATPQSQISILAARPATTLSSTSNFSVPAQIVSLAANKSIKLSQNNNSVTPPSTSSNLFLPAQKGSAVMVVHNATDNTTQVFALTDGDIKISDRQQKKTVSLLGGQTVAVKNGLVGNVQEFDLQGFYQIIALTDGLGAGEENLVAQESPPVQQTLKAVRIETLAALKNQAKRMRGFKSSFLRDALGGTEGDLNPRQPATVRIRNPQVLTGIFRRTSNNTAVFIPDNNPNSPIPIGVDFDKQTININGSTGISNNAGLSGNNASGTVIERNGEARRIEVFGVNGEEPAVGAPFRGSLTTGVIRDR
ncbi:hypothetical protein F7734_01380 [Scytonema sp. UIC 10036]|uniref:FecR domain-containing protein n=1 Tax=Scytonema sp. UIC 10036 TaxID=2304196 RepID=UPI0012DA6F7B|nr:FecR domain-containing protein [Scytonema sp. UIC 10036]MUG91221.1 hypothetical protein [Scytonema sp. UIC 10036]